LSSEHLNASSTPDDSVRLRLSDLDGIRGWASLSVVLYHIFWETFGHVEPVFCNWLTAALFNGAMAVSIFFVLSGEALSTNYWRTGNRGSVVRLFVKRYPRLTVPVFFSCLAVFVLMKLGLIYSSEAAVIVNSPGWLGAFLRIQPTFSGLLRYATVGVFLHQGQDRSQAYNPFLWTMRPEMLGSLAVFGCLFAERYVKQKLMSLIAIAIVFFMAKSFVGCFLCGVIFARAQTQGYFNRLQDIRWLQPLTLVGITVVLAFIARMQFADNFDVRPFTVAAAVLLAAVHCNKTISGFLTNRLSVWLGKISFPLYLVHFPVIVSFTSVSIVVVQAHGGLTAPWIVAIALASAALSVAAAAAFGPVEVLTRWICDWVGTFVLPVR
jgi:peptidoglycan/LPS O-acetylase OafA/YrhL